VVVMLGTNDLKQRFGASAMDVAQGVERLLACIEQSATGPQGKAPACLVVAPVPVLETGYFADIFRGGAEKSRRLAGALAAMVARRPGVHLIDAGAVAEVDSRDGIHLDAVAHAAIGRAVAAKMAEMLE
jgi:lysophospholipase L1-like esterase